MTTKGVVEVSRYGQVRVVNEVQLLARKQPRHGQLLAQREPRDLGLHAAEVRAWWLVGFVLPAALEQDVLVLAVYRRQFSDERVRVATDAGLVVSRVDPDPHGDIKWPSGCHGRARSRTTRRATPAFARGNALSRTRARAREGQQGPKSIPPPSGSLLATA